MFRQKQYDNTECNLLIDRLKYLESNNIIYYKIKFWDINIKGWVDCDNLSNYKIQREIITDDELIFYIYLEEYNAEQ